MKKWSCKRCNYIHLGETPPVKCPVCGAPAAEFIEVGYSDLPAWRRLFPQVFLHPILVHFPNALVSVALLFLLLSWVFELRCFEPAAFYLLVVVLLSAPIAAAAGYYDWKTRFNGELTLIFKIKLGCSLLLIALLFILVVWRLIDDTIFIFSSTKLIFMLLVSGALILVSVLGHYGGIITFGRIDDE